MLGLISALFLASFPTGRVVEKVACTTHPENTYALYLPSAYTPERTWPIVIALDAGKQALDPMAAFRETAERHGVIVVSSWDSQSDTDSAPTVAAVRAMWDDVHERFAIDDHRVYFAGYSGTVRLSCYLAFNRPGAITGIIGASAGFPVDRRPKRDMQVLFFGTSGVHDFNYSELTALDAELDGLQLPHRVELFDGGHEWMPPRLADEALDWLELHATKDPERIAALWAADLARAKALESSGELVDAARIYRSLAKDYNKDEATTAAKRVEAMPEYAAKLKARRRSLDFEKATISRAEQILAREKDDLAVIDQLHIAALRKEAADSGEQALASGRVLSTLFGQTAFYKPHELKAQKQYAKALHYLRIAAAIRPESSRVHYNIAALCSLSGDRRGALDELQRAFAAGFTDLERLRNDPDFASLREEEGFRKLTQ